MADQLDSKKSDKKDSKKSKTTTDFSYHNINPAIHPVNWMGYQVDGKEGNMLDPKYQD